MTVSELIEKLKNMPSDAKVYYEGGDHKDDYREVYSVKNEKHLGWGKSGVLVS